MAQSNTEHADQAQSDQFIVAFRDANSVTVDWWTGWAKGQDDAVVRARSSRQAAWRSLCNWLYTPMLPMPDRILNLPAEVLPPVEDFPPGMRLCDPFICAGGWHPFEPYHRDPVEQNDAASLIEFIIWSDPILKPILMQGETVLVEISSISDEMPFQIEFKIKIRTLYNPFKYICCTAKTWNAIVFILLGQGFIGDFQHTEIYKYQIVPKQSATLRAGFMGGIPGLKAGLIEQFRFQRSDISDLLSRYDLAGDHTS